jgi:hypothetical protein
MTDSVRWPLAAIAAVGLLVGVLPFLWMFKRAGRALSRRPQPPVSASRYLLAVASGVFLIGAGLAALGLSVALTTYHSFTKKRHVAEVQAIQLGPQKLRVFFQSIEADGTRGPTETYDVDGDEWTVGGDILRFKPFWTLMGLETVYKITRVEGRWLKADDANVHKATAFDRDGGTSQGWLQLYRNGAKLPFGWMVAGAHGQAVSQLPDRRSVYDLYVTPNGFIVDKRSL